MLLSAPPSATCNTDRVFSGLAPTPLGNKFFVIEQANRFPKLKILTSRKQSEMRSSGGVLGLEQAARALWTPGRATLCGGPDNSLNPNTFGDITGSNPAQKDVSLALKNPHSDRTVH